MGWRRSELCHPRIWILGFPARLDSVWRRGSGGSTRTARSPPQILAHPSLCPPDLRAPIPLEFPPWGAAGVTNPAVRGPWPWGPSCPPRFVHVPFLSSGAATSHSSHPCLALLSPPCTFPDTRDCGSVFFFLYFFWTFSHFYSSFFFDFPSTVGRHLWPGSVGLIGSLIYLHLFC